MSVFDENVLINKYFKDIASLPHGSYHEEKVVDYIENVAIQHQLRYMRDEMHNIVVFKEASKGYEKHAPIMLQAHTDMVCEKNNDSSHDFDNEGLCLYEEDGYLKAKGTTLGADDGVGVAYMLAILTDSSLKHPPLECVFTVQEEVGLYGAFGLDMSILKARRMIGLDSETEGETCTSSSGGLDVFMTKSMRGEDNTSPVYVLEVKGLQGGHSGECINKDRGNANKLASRILFHMLKKGIDVRLIDITGGLKNNAIPRECVVAFASESDALEIQEIVQECEKHIKKEFEISDPYVSISLRSDECDVCICSKDSEAIITMMYLCRNGMIKQSQVIDGLTTLSLNMGVVRTNDNDITIDYSIRSPLKSARDELASQLELIASLFNACVEVSGDYPGWDYDPHSKIRQQFSDFYLKQTGQHLKEVATHGGLETGIFKGKIPDLDIMTLGPNMSGIHTPEEKLELRSFLHTYELLTSFLEVL